MGVEMAIYVSLVSRKQYLQGYKHKQHSIPSKAT